MSNEPQPTGHLDPTAIMAAFGAIADSVGVLGSVAWAGYGSTFVARRLLQATKLIEAFRAVHARMVVAAEERQVWQGSSSAKDVAGYLAEYTGAAYGEMKRQHDLGQLLDAVPEVGERIADGLLSTGTARALAPALLGDQALPDDAAADLLQSALGAAPKHAQRLTADALAAARTTPETAEETVTRLRGLRTFTLAPSLEQPGMHRASGLLVSEDAERVIAALRSMHATAGDGPDEARTPDQQLADALVDLSAVYLSGKVSGGQHRPTGLVITTPDQLHALRHDHHDGCCTPGTLPGLARSGTGDALLAPSLRERLCDIVLHRITLAGSEVLDLGRGERLIDRKLFLALAARDGGCRHPGCHRPPAWCHGHHIIHWTEGGRTDPSNCVLLCAYHHSLVHRAGWTMTGTATHLTITRPDGTHIHAPPPQPQPQPRQPVAA